MQVSILAENIVAEILDELGGRSGIGDALDSIDEDIMEELEISLQDIVKDNLKKYDTK